MRPMGRAFIPMFLVGCAMGGSAANEKTDAAVRYDGQHVTGDATIHHDARLADAFVPRDAPADADTSSGFCGDNTQCGPTTCCWIAVCVPGTPIGMNLCFPN